MIEICIHVPQGRLEATVYRIDRREGGEDGLVAIHGPEAIQAAQFDRGATLDPDAIRSLLAQNVNSGDFSRKGRALLGALGAGGKWLEQRRLANGDLRTYLRIEHPMLKDLPWELLTHDLTSLFSSSSCLRTTEQLPPQDDSEPVWPIRLFVINAADPSVAGLEAAGEVWKIRGAVHAAEHSFDLEVLNTAADAPLDIDRLEHALTRMENGVSKWPGGPHILHFIGHSVADPDPILQLFTPEHGGTYIDWTRVQIAALMERLPSLRLVYLNACRSQDHARDPAAPMSTADAFLGGAAGGAAAVIAMQTAVRGEAAATCAGAFYFALAEGQDVDSALMVARGKLLAKYSENSPAMYSPVMTTRVAAGDILKRKKFQWTTEDDQKWQAALREDRKDNWKHFVDQRPRRRELFGALLSAGPRPAVVLHGDKEVGKTWLLRWSAYAIALHGVTTHYVQAASDMDWLSVLRRLRDGTKVPYSPGISPALRGEFNWTLNHLAHGKTPLPAPAGKHEDEAGTLSEIMQRGEVVNGFDGLICDAMAHALREEAKTRILVVALDDLSLSALAVLKKCLLEQLCAATNIRVVLCVNDERLETYGQHDFTDWLKLPVLIIDRQLVPDLACEILRLQYPGSDTSSVEGKIASFAAASLKVGALYDFCWNAGQLAGLK
jgi:hypothetical protein